WSVTGTRCFAAGAGQAALRGTSSTRSRRGYRYCDQSCISLIGSCRLSRCCESPSEERSAGKLHATFCGNRRRATASGDPVPAVKFLGLLSSSSPASLSSSDDFEIGSNQRLLGSSLSRSRLLSSNPNKCGAGTMD